jgi:hypothetical protein
MTPATTRIRMMYATSARRVRISDGIAFLPGPFASAFF